VIDSDLMVQVYGNRSSKARWQASDE